MLGGGTRAGSPIWADSKRAGHTPGHTLTGGRTRQYARAHANTRAHTPIRARTHSAGTTTTAGAHRPGRRATCAGRSTESSSRACRCRRRGRTSRTSAAPPAMSFTLTWTGMCLVLAGVVRWHSGPGPSYVADARRQARRCRVCVCVCARARRHGRQARQYRRPACAALMSVCARRASVCAQHTGACAQHTAVGARRQGGGIVEFANKSDQEYALSKLDDTEFTARNGDKVRRDSAESPVAAAHGARVRARLCAHVHTDAYACVQCRPT